MQLTAVQLATSAVIGTVGVANAAKALERARGTWLIDLTPSLPIDPNLKGRFGGGPVFAQVLETEIVPFVRSRFAPDMQRQAICVAPRISWTAG